MKVIRLEMNAFSTYHQKTIIDFENLIDNGLYLITGSTGAGKTTIFDAITFALYGSASGSERNQSHFRSDYADAKEETYVELTFELHEKIYTVKRSPTYMRQGYKTAKMAYASLLSEGKMIEGIKEVNQKINQLLGVDVHQFKQIVMIAQGEFRKLIYASSEEREKVLRHVFHTEPLVAFENQLKEQTKQYKEEYNLLQQQLIHQYQLLSFSQTFMENHANQFHPSYIEDAIKENQSIQQDCKQHQENYQAFKEDYDHLSQEYYEKQKRNQDILTYQRLNNDYQKHLQQKEKMFNYQQDIEKMKILKDHQTMLYQYHHIQKDIQKNQEQLKDILQDHDRLEKQYQQINQQYQQLPQLTKEKEDIALYIHQINQKIEQQKSYQRIEKELKYQQSLYQDIKTQYDDCYNKHEHSYKRIERDQERVNELPQLELQLENIDRLVKESNQKRISIHDLSELYDHYKDIQEKHYEYAKIYQEKDKHYQLLLQQYQREDENFKRQQAGILALNLKEGIPCPVCGATHHPKLAKISSHVLSSKELEKLAKRLELSRVDKEDIYQEVLLQNEDIQSIKSKIDVYKSQLNIEEDLSKEVFIQLLSSIVQMNKQQKTLYQKQYTEVEYRKKIKKSLEQDKMTYEKQSEQLDKLFQDYHEKEKLLTSYQTQLNSLNEELSDYDYVSLLKEKTVQLKNIETNIQRIDHDYHHIQQALSLNKQKEQSIKSQKEELENTFIQVQEEYHCFIDKYFPQHDYQKYMDMLKQLDEKEKIYQEYCIQEQTLLAQLEQLQDYKDLKMIDLSKEKDMLYQKEIKKDELLKVSNELLMTYKQNENIIADIQKTYQRNQDIFQKYTTYLDLSDYTSGKNSQRMSFERYVLSAYFEHILEYANIELMKMTQGRFALYRKQEIKGAKQQGLDLSILDYETGMMRDIQSLSGGESFKAALSLALGLSSMIQSYAGGIELNTLFIDEGFGSLDSESLEQALAVLLDLKNDHKVIGIISHVRELKERITTQIVVEKTQDGSQLHIEKD